MGTDGRQVVDDRAIPGGAAAAGGIAAVNESRQAGFELAHLFQLGAHLVQMHLRQVAHFLAGAVAIFEQFDQVLDLPDRKAEIAAALDEG